MNIKSGGIYSITSKVNGKRYIGSSVTINTRWKTHKQELKNNKHSNLHLQNHYNKYGSDSLIFTVLEIIEKENLSLQDYKKCLLAKEQTYLDNWKECHFNIRKRATCCSGFKQKECKYYSFTKNKYNVQYTIFGNSLSFGVFITEEEAIAQVEYIKSLTEQEILDYHASNYEAVRANKNKRGKNTKGYSYHKKIKLYVVGFKDLETGKSNYYGCYKTEEEAKQRAEEVKKELGGFD